MRLVVGEVEAIEAGIWTVGVGLCDEEAAFNESFESTVHVLIGLVAADLVTDRFAVVRTLADSLKDFLFEATLAGEADGLKLVEGECLYIIDDGQGRREMLGCDGVGAVECGVHDSEFMDMSGKACEELAEVFW
jgi:hypothetical protein